MTFCNRGADAERRVVDVLRRRLTRYNEDWEQDRGYSFFIFRRDDDELLGGITLSNVRRGVSQSCSFGY